MLGSAHACSECSVQCEIISLGKLNPCFIDLSDLSNLSDLSDLSDLSEN